MEKPPCPTCLLKSICGMVGQIEGQAEAGTSLPNGKQGPLDEENMKLFLIDAERLVAQYGCNYPEEFEDEVLRIRALMSRGEYGLI